ncbi:ABC transporter ATP-binding protein [Flindersiella endophytica]
MRRVALALLAKAFPGRLALIAGMSLLNGALPAIFAALVADLVQRLPAAVDAGFDSTAGRGIVSTLTWIAVVLVAREAASAGWTLIEDLFWRYDGYLRRRIMRATLSVPRLELFEDPELAATTDRAVRFVEPSPGEIVAGYGDKWSAHAQGLAATVLVATVWPAAAVFLAVIWIVASHQLRVNHARARGGGDDPFRRAQYLHNLGTMPEWAKEVRVFGLVSWLADRFGREWATAMTQLWRARRTGQRAMGLVFALVVVGNGIVLGLAARAASDGRLGVGTVTVLAQGVLGMAFLADQDSDHLIDLGVLAIPGFVAMEKAVADVPIASGTKPADCLPAREICFEGVRFAYPGRDSTVFDGLDLRIEAATSLGIVGLNGAGKTTLIKLLAGLELPQRGRIAVDGIDLTELNLASWRRAVTAIFQDFVRYELSARDNIAFGAAGDLTDDRIVHCARRAGAEDIVAGLPQGLDTSLSRRFPGGVDLSGGQWQRIALARALAAVEAGARVLVLDEPTAQLDVRAEADIYERFLDLTRGLTTIVISHRFSTVRRADRIVVLDGGRVSEDGSHQELLAADGQYARLFRTQAMRYTSGGHHA